MDEENNETQITDEVTAICKEAGIARESFLRLVSKHFDRSQIKRNADGAITNRADLVASVKANYADFLSTTSTKGTPPVTPPAGGSSRPAREEIFRKDAGGRYVHPYTERLKMIAEHLEEFV